MFKKFHDSCQNQVTVYIDGAAFFAETTETVASVLLRDAQLWSRTTPVSEVRRAPYCMMGVCFDCLAVVDGALLQTCLVSVRDGMRVERQHGRRKVTS
ncbi:(2Fe-2S)-binding protein [Rhizobium pusense]|uniref:(2Fe-2S)-binding protein n=1 Tax=Agrobacterium pusense TaxID=648995 RepID=UPI000DDA2035|nr:(2Fe-2S)-binding protein [Agrobacterium pusense]MBW9081153.1 (2Fe-2S)-binding protein [Agrobacterium pusense]